MSDGIAYLHQAGTVPVDWLQLVLAAAFALGLSAGAAAYIRPSLFGVLAQVCGTDVAARFWTSFSVVLTVVGPLYLVFVAAGNATSLADFVRRSVYLASFGIIAAFAVMGAAVMLSPPSQAMSRRRAAQVAAEGVARDADPRILR